MAHGQVLLHMVAAEVRGTEEALAMEGTRSSQCNGG